MIRATRASSEEAQYIHGLVVLSLIKTVWIGPHIYGEEFFMYKGDNKKSMDVKRMGRYQMQLNF